MLCTSVNKQELAEVLVYFMFYILDINLPDQAEVPEPVSGKMVNFL